jgi:hypothetical protein
MKIALALALLFAPLTNPQPLGEPLPRYAMGVVADQPTVPEGYFVGTATWFDAERGSHSSWYTRAGVTLYGAIGAEVRAYKQHYWRTSWDVKITSLLTGKSVIVHVVDECTCYGVRANPDDQRLIDLSPQTWKVLGVPLSRGVMPITLEVLP